MSRSLPRTADVVIGGGGIIGCAIAREAGRMVLLLERNSIGSAATSRAAALLTQVRAKTCLMPLVRQTYEDIAALQEEAGLDLDLRTVGGLHLAASEESRSEQALLAAVATRHGVAHRRLSPLEAAERTPWRGKVEETVRVEAHFILNEGHHDSPGGD